ncbi:argininosuccinate lyase [Virgibacillus halophilus]|uniref:Argininosuccinate lyase n=1 Tax=Tigheibacillus halophilus TaxID=361280 RepID=A0ABU5C460_9BACI|nr:argininosuccinate lyase [Virgibacillus halophilus]
MTYDNSAFVRDEGSVFPGKTYVNELLKPIFIAQREHLFQVMFELHRAHVVMLHEQNLLTESEKNEIFAGLSSVEAMDPVKLEYQPAYEDLFFLVEAKLGERIGTDLAGKMHMGRSRNDMGEGMYRIVLRGHILSLLKDVTQLSEALLGQASNHLDSVMPAHTHTQPAQPTTFGHFLTAIFDNLQRDRMRLCQAFRTVNRSPLGAAAITTTGFPINRQRVADLLGFDGLMENSYDAIGTGDYLLETAQAVASLMVNTGRWVQEFLRFATFEVGLISVAAPYVQISSIMPQKRNPVSVEHARALSSSALGEAMTVVHMLHNTPYGDIVDTEDDLQPHLYRSFHKASRVLKLMNAVVRTMTFNKERAKAEARKNMITITEFADVLARDHAVSFRKAHHIASLVAAESLQKGKELHEWSVADMNEIIRKIGVQLTEQEWQDIVDPAVFVERRFICGGPNAKEVQRMVEDRQHKLNAARQKLDHTSKRLTVVKNHLHSLG